MIKNVHIIVAPSPWNQDPLKYRRHRLAVFLRNQVETKEVVWISPMVSNSYKALFSPAQQEILPSGIRQVIIPDYKSLTKHLEVFQMGFPKELDLSNVKHSYFLWYTYPAFAMLARMNHWQRIIYDCSDMWKEAEKADSFFLGRIKKALTVNTERQIIKKADVCFASSSTLARSIETQYKKHVVLVENGVDFEIFNTKNRILENQSSSPSRPVLGFIGGLKPWKIDFSLLLEVARRRVGWDLILVGSFYGKMDAVYKELSKQPNVKIYPAVPSHTISSYVNRFDVGLLPYLNNDYNQGVFPLKFHEYLACGVPVVGSGLPSMVQHIEKNVFELVQNDVDTFIRACEKAISNKNIDIEKRIHLARKADWRQKLQFMWEQVK